MPPMYGAMKELNMVTVCGIETQRALMDSGARGPMIAPIKDHVRYEPPAKKDITIKMWKLPDSNRRISEKLQNAMETESAYDFFHISPSLPNKIPKTAEPKKETEPKTPISKSPY